MDLGVDVAATDAGTPHPLNDLKSPTDPLTGRRLGVGRPPIDRHRPGVVREVASIGRAKIEDVELAGPGATRPGRASADAGSVVVPRVGEHFAARLDRGPLECREDGQLAHARLDHRAGRAVHRAGGVDRPAEEAELVGVLAAAEIPEDRIDIDQFGVREEAGDMGTAGRELDGDAPRRRPACEPTGEHGRRRLPLVEPERRSPLALVGANIVCRGGIDDLVGADEEHVS